VIFSWQLTLAIPRNTIRRTDDQESEKPVQTAFHPPAYSRAEGKTEMSSLKDLLRTAIALAILLAIASLLTGNSRISAAATATKSTAPAHGYYLTRGTYDGSQASTACVSGYHMASIYELHETSNLSYNTTLGYNADDDGSGPPPGLFGWTRSSGGVHSCSDWTSNSSSEWATAFELDPVWSDSPGLFAPWVPSANGSLTCNFQFQVWCVQD
jgi:hypothetical protein